MAIVRWNPMADVMALHNEMDRLFGELTDGVGVGRLGDERGGPRQAFLPVDIERSGDAVLVHASVPGYSPEEVSVTVGGGVLTITATHADEAEHGEGVVVRRERFRGRLFRQVALGEDVRGDEARATFDNGVLTVSVPLVPAVEPKRIPVQVAGG